jgi:hypothetical protein
MGTEPGSWGRSFRAQGSRRAAVRRVLATAAALQPPPEAAAAPRLLAEGARGCVDMGQRSRLLLGRGRACHLVLQGSGVSRVHAAVVRRGGEYWIEDLGSANGVWRCGERVLRSRIADGEEFRLCDAVVRFHLW